MMTEGLLRSPLHVITEAELSGLDDLLHDETFDLDGIEHNSTTQTLTIPVRRQFHGGPERIIEDGPLWKTYQKDWMRSLVTIRHVRSWQFEHDQGINSYSFCSWGVSDSVMIIECNEALILTVSIDAIDVRVEDIGFKGKARIRRGPMGTETSSSEVHE
jgi:hypothetical protein